MFLLPGSGAPVYILYLVLVSVTWKGDEAAIGRPTGPRGRSLQRDETACRCDIDWMLICMYDVVMSHKQFQL